MQDDPIAQGKSADAPSKAGSVRDASRRKLIKSAVASVPFVLTLSARTAYAQGGSPAYGTATLMGTNLEAADGEYQSQPVPFRLYSEPGVDESSEAADSSEGFGEF